MTLNLTDCTTLETLNTFVNQLEATPPGLLGGRYYKPLDNENYYTLKEIIHLFSTIAPKNTENPTEISQMVSIKRSLKDLNRDGHKCISESFILFRILTKIKQLIGNLFYNKELVLKGILSQKEKTILDNKLSQDLQTLKTEVSSLRTNLALATQTILSQEQITDLVQPLINASSENILSQDQITAFVQPLINASTENILSQDQITAFVQPLINAEQMEHIITPELEKELTLLLKDPQRDPHHQPIPPKETL